MAKKLFYEFFAGGGMARAGLGQQNWRCLFANDFDHKKSRIYRENWGKRELVTGDVGRLTTADLPGRANLVWASFPCQDLSLAGGGAGLRGDRSGTFWPFWRLMNNVIAEGRAPEIIALENVCGTLTSHGGRDFTAICDTFRTAGYRFGAMVIDAALFVPQSRPRLFMIGVHSNLPIPDGLVSENPSPQWHTAALLTAFNRLPEASQENWLWWNLPLPAVRTSIFSDLVEHESTDVVWHTPEATAQLLELMGPLHLAKVERAKESGRRMVGTIYRRTREEAAGKSQRAEVRFDDVAGCLRTPSGGSSRQIIMVVEGHEVKSRLISRRETARLMGLPDTYILPENYNEAYHLTGDGVASPVVRHLARHIFEPFIAAQAVARQVELFV
ncbi:MAG: DNA cytosine methyltransferase [Janthinobacterium lividum]